MTEEKLRQRVTELRALAASSVFPEERDNALRAAAAIEAKLKVPATSVPRVSVAGAGAGAMPAESLVVVSEEGDDSVFESVAISVMDLMGADARRGDGKIKVVVSGARGRSGSRALRVVMDLRVSLSGQGKVYRSAFARTIGAMAGWSTGQIKVIETINEGGIKAADSRAGFVAAAECATRLMEGRG